MREVFEVVAIVLLLLVILAALVLAAVEPIKQLYRLISGRVPMYKIVRFGILMLIGLGVLYPILSRVERHSPMHLLIKPEAEALVTRSAEARQLIGDSISFSSESYSYSDHGHTGQGDLTMRAKGSNGSGDVNVTAIKVGDIWRVHSIELVMKDKRVPIPAN